MSDLLRLLQMLQQGGQSASQSDFPAPLHPRIMEQRNMLRGDPYAEQIFQQAYGGQDNGPEAPQYEQSRHPGIEGVTGAVGDYLDQSNFRPRNFGEGLAAGFLKGGVGAFNEGAQAREGRNAEKKAAYKAEQKAAFEQKALAQKQYGDMAMEAHKAANRPQSDIERTAMVDIPGVGKVPATSSIGQEFLYSNGTVPRPPRPQGPEYPEMNGEDVATLAQIYVGGGGMPPRGSLSKEGWTQFFGEVTKLVKGGGDPTANKANVVANQASLVQISKNLNAVESFGRTAEKNANVMMARMKLIPDTGIPYLNTPIRELARKGGGSAEVAAYRAALTTVIPEFSRLLNNPNLTGQLTDTARKEMEHVIDGSSTLNQMMKTLEVLKQDKENRINDLRQQQQQIKEGLKNPFLNGGGAPSGGASDTAIEFVRVNGKLVPKGSQ